MENANFTLSLEHFQGPMDVLVHLIERDKIPIGQIPIGELCDQYIAFLLPHLERDLEELSAFVLMAARLLELKARALLPKKTKDDEPDDENELARRLEQYIKYKKIGQALKNMQSGDCHYRAKSPEFALFCKAQIPSVSQILANESLVGLRSLHQELLRRQNYAANTATTAVSAIQPDPFTIEEKIRHIIGYLKTVGQGHFSQLFPPDAEKPEKLTTFLAMLELAKDDSLKISQPLPFSEISIMLK